jgi:hypothetical protein
MGDPGWRPRQNCVQLESYLRQPQVSACANASQWGLNGMRQQTGPCGSITRSRRPGGRPQRNCVHLESTSSNYTAPWAPKPLRGVGGQQKDQIGSL